MSKGQGTYHISALGGAYRDCPVCGKHWYIVDVDCWAYTKWIKENHSGIPTAFCSWTCLRKWEKEHPPKKEFIHPTVPANSERRWYR